MKKINWLRFVIGGVIAAVIFFLSDGLMHEQVLSSDWRDVYLNISAIEPEHHGSSMLYFTIFELGRGMLAMFLYVLMRAFWGAGPRTAILAGVAVWIAFSVTGPAQFIPLGFFTVQLWLKVAGFQLITSIFGSLAGAALYKDVSATGPSSTE